MATLADMMLEVARQMGGMHEGTSGSTGTTTTLVDTELIEAADTFNDGTLFPTSGSNAGNSYRVSDFASPTVTISVAASYAFANGITYAIAPGTFPKHLIKQAVLASLVTVEIPTLNSAHTASAGECTLSGISNAMRVYVDDVRNYHWSESGGKIIFDDDGLAGALDIWYLAKHAVIAESGTINLAVNLEWLKWASVAYLYRNYVQLHEKDDPIALELMNEAKINMMGQTKLSVPTMKRDPHLASW